MPSPDAAGSQRAFSPQLFGSKPVTVHVRSTQEAAPFHLVVPIWLDSHIHAYPSFVDPSTHVAPEPHETPSHVFSVQSVTAPLSTAVPSNAS
ncbi:MAG: hypothetical protein VXV71_04885, partial [Candidatus Thermoplasmatota archaeon]|nr:hypothetical protein [Candidatus Thermoplasmatota archaeon]